MLLVIYIAHYILPVDGTNGKKHNDVKSDTKKDESKKDEAKKDVGKKDVAKKDVTKKDDVMKEGSKAVTLVSTLKTCRFEC